MSRARRKRSTFNPFISLTDILFNLALVLIFVSALFAIDVNKKYGENEAFKNRLAALQLERDELVGNLEVAEDVQAALEETNTSLEDQISGLVANLDSAQVFQQALAERISILIGELDDEKLRSEALNENITVILGDLELAETQKKLLEDEVTITLGNLTEAEQAADSLRSQVSELSRNNFLVVELEWLTESHDLDLHVVDPKGNRFYWNNVSFEGESSRLTLDNRLGARPNKPGLEIWTARDLALGTYRIELGLWGCDRANDLDSYKPCSTDGLANVLLRHRDGDDLVASIPVPANESYANVSGSEFTLNEELFDRLLLVAEVQIIEQDGEVIVQVDAAEGLESRRLPVTN